MYVNMHMCIYMCIQIITRCIFTNAHDHGRWVNVQRVKRVRNTDTQRLRIANNRRHSSESGARTGYVRDRIDSPRECP